MEDGTTDIIKNKRCGWHILLLGMITLMLFVTARYFYNTEYFGEYKAPHKGTYTNYDYFIEMADEEGKIILADYAMYMYSAFVTMIGDRDVVFDDRVMEADYWIMLPQYSRDDIGILNTNFEDKASDCQRYYLIDENGQEHKVFLLTGKQWESASAIKIFYDLEKNLIVAPEESFDKEDFADIEIQLEKFSCETAIMQTKMDETIQRVSGENHKWEISIRQLAFILFIAFLGVIAGGTFLKKLEVMAVWYVLPFGFMTGIFSALLLIVSHLKISLLNYILISCVTAVLLNMYIKKHIDFTESSFKYNKTWAINILLWAGVVLWFCFKPYIILSYDSVLNEYYGKYAVLTGDLNAVLGGVLSYSLITPLYEVGSSLFEIELNYSMQPIFVISFMAAMGWIWFKMIKNPTRIKIVMMLWGILALIINPMFYIQMFWKLNNLSLGMFVGISVGMHLLYYMTEEKIYFIIGNIFFPVVYAARVEGGVFAIVHLVCLYMLFKNKGKEKEVESLCFRMGLILTVLYLYYFCIIGEVKSDFWTHQKGLAMNILIWFAYLLIRIGPLLKGWARKVFDNMDKAMPLFISLVIVLAGLINKEKIIHNMYVYVRNLNNYGGYWELVVMIALYSIFRCKEKPILRFFSIYVISYFLLIPGLMVFREIPLRIGFGDSACRMLSHIVLVGGSLLIYFANELFIDKVKRTRVEKNGGNDAA
ncbi:hypothetical protein D7X98_18265 [bacterium 1XD8-76]|nr:hypothetical protein D7X98_18265 [bacterium 1XD8-76]